MGNSIDFSLDVKSFSSLRRDILDGMAEEIRKIFQRVLEPIKVGVGIAVAGGIRSSEEYSSLLNGKLRSELGVIKAEPALEGIIQRIVQGIRVSSLGARRRGKDLEGGIRIEILKKDYSEVLEAPRAFYYSKEHKIDWIRWLTLEGDKIIVSDHRISYGHPDSSRTGSAIMIPKGTWRVPPEYAGTDRDNWITRSIDKIAPEIEKIVEQAIRNS